ncbi:hypothetical protein BT96DRAFT_577564 [Gymnopus androsaceus JB14]|uniref:Uncharacterized protein n=1 Tax=Gymnopus androsaceus JB14 TaxID=1447944 RepID=A0A6A4HXE6_9AGAR|nr:hypothetical protein BT96DRAFT_577564 [Gymnopus androsaceus JB14]
MRRNPPPFPTSNPSASSSSFSARRAADARTRASARLMAAAPANERRAGGSRFGLRRALAAPLAARPATRTFPHGPGDMHLVGLLRQHFFEPLNALDFGSGIDDFGFEPGFPGPYARRNEEEEDYLAEYTHPGKGKPPVGFSFDIDLSPPTRDSSVAAPSSPKTRKLPITSLENPIVLDDDGEIVEEPKAEGKVEELELKLASGSRPAASPSTVAQLTISVSLVCSKCLDPLLLGEGATAMASLTASTEVDVDRVQVPERERNARRYRIWGLRCGHLIDGKCLEALGYPPRALDAETKRKWKEKACDNDVAGAGNNDGEGKTQSEESASFSNSIRARLRSATSNTSSSESTVTAPPSLLHRIFGSRPQPKTVPKIQETYIIWRCPVANCRREHVSVKMDDGVWRQGQGQGERRRVKVLLLCLSSTLLGI